MAVWGRIASIPPLKAGLLRSLQMVVWKRQPISPPGQEGIKGWSIENIEKTPKRTDFSQGWRSTTPPVQEGNLNRYAEENLTALPFEGGIVRSLSRFLSTAPLHHRLMVKNLLLHHSPLFIHHSPLKSSYRELPMKWGEGHFSVARFSGRRARFIG